VNGINIQKQMSPLHFF